MVCTKCQKLQTTKLATPDVKKKSEIYYGSPASSSKPGSSAGSSKTSATLGQTGVGKVRHCHLPSGVPVMTRDRC